MLHVPIESFLNENKELPIIDVRSPGEFEKGHVPGAVNLPIFTDLERAKVGTIYKQKSKDEAISVGLEIVGPKMKTMAEAARSLARDKKLKLYCWRGGMRSEKMAWLFELVGLETIVLNNGYKAFRNHMHNSFKRIEQLIVIQGPTGSGKTLILNVLEKLGEQVIDLEGLAHHKGSAFGGLGELQQPTTEQFQNNVFDKMMEFDFNRPIWIESESMTIGKVYLPEELWEKMNLAKVISIEVPREVRIKNIVDQYGNFNTDQLMAKTKQLRQKLGSKKIDTITECIDSGNLERAVDLLLDYYDKTYAHSASKYKHNKPLPVSLSSDDPARNARILLNQVYELQQ